MLRRFNTGQVIGFFLFDWFGTLAVLVTATYLRVKIGVLPVPFVLFLEKLQIPVVKWWDQLTPEDILAGPVVLLVSIIWPAFFLLFSVYNGRRNVSMKVELVNVFMAIMASTLVLSGILFLTYRATSRVAIILFFFMDLVLLLGARLIWFGINNSGSNLNKKNRRAVLIVGAGEVGQNFAKELRTTVNGNVEIAGFLDDDPILESQSVMGLPVLGKSNQVDEIIKLHQICDAVVALPMHAHEHLVEVCKKIQNHSVRVYFIPDLFDITFPGSNLENYSGIPIIDLGDPNILGQWQIVKRFFDLIVIALGLMFVAPIFLIIAVLIKISSPGPIFFLQPRIGLGGKQFMMVKFRTMHVDADTLLKKMLSENPALKHEWNEYQKLSNDPRITTMGKILRRLSLDELPQIWNIIRGEMSLIGPRPFLPSQLELYGKQAYLNYIRVRPGITGMWQVSGRNQTSFASRAQWDDYYIRNWSLGLDLKILYQTIGVVLQREGAY